MHRCTRKILVLQKWASFQSKKVGGYNTMKCRENGVLCGARFPARNLSNRKAHRHGDNTNVFIIDWPTVCMLFLFVTRATCIIYGCGNKQKTLLRTFRIGVSARQLWEMKRSKVFSPTDKGTVRLSLVQKILIKAIFMCVKSATVCPFWGV